ncbi:MAG: NUDIX hydrolase [Anaerovoracaceae bacterium]
MNTNHPENSTDDSISLEMFRHRAPQVIISNRCFRSAVCIPVLSSPAGPVLLFEKRSSSISDQPGDICFPGGRMEEGETPREAAVREICEELLVTPDKVRVAGPADFLHMERLVVFPFVVELSDYDGSFSRDEVSEVFTVPLSWLLGQPPEEYELGLTVQPKEGFPYDRIVGGENYRWRDRSETVYFYQYGEHTIWGITAKILHSFLQRVKTGISIQEAAGPGLPEAHRS